MPFGRPTCFHLIGSSSLPSLAFSPQQIDPVFLDSLATDGYCVIPKWLSPTAICKIKSDSAAFNLANSASKAFVGSGATARLDESIRKSSLKLLFPPVNPRLGDVDTRSHLYNAVQQLRRELQGYSALDFLPQLQEFDVELNYLYYPQGGLYGRHLDVPRQKDGWVRVGRSAQDGTSIQKHARRRIISFILYLNNDWKTDIWGGQLRIFKPQRQTSETKSMGEAENISINRSDLEQDDIKGQQNFGNNSDEEFIDVAPEGGTLVLLQSRHVTHQVLVTHEPRQCVVGWFCEHGVVSF